MTVPTSSSIRRSRIVQNLSTGKGIGRNSGYCLTQTFVLALVHFPTGYMPYSLNLLYPSELFHSIPDWCPSVSKILRPMFTESDPLSPCLSPSCISSQPLQGVVPALHGGWEGWREARKRVCRAEKALQTVTNNQARGRGVRFSHWFPSHQILAAQIFKFCLFQIFNQIHKENENCEIINKKFLKFPLYRNLTINLKLIFKRKQLKQKESLRN